MASYYYLISSLPDLRTDGDMPMTYDEFLDMCQSNVSESKYELLKNLTLSSEEGPLLKEWSAFYKNLMGELNYQIRTPAGSSLPPADSSQPLQLQQPVRSPNPYHRMSDIYSGMRLN